MIPVDDLIKFKIFLRSVIIGVSKMSESCWCDFVGTRGQDFYLCFYSINRYFSDIFVSRSSSLFSFY